MEMMGAGWWWHGLEPLEARMLLSGTPFTLLPLGDSITEGDQGQNTWRRPLWHMLTDAGYEVDFLGSKRSQAAIDDFDRDHEGHSGWRADEILNGRVNRPEEGRLSEWLDDYTADIVLLHIGTNDLNQGQDPQRQVNDVRDIINTLRDDNPDVTIFLAQIIPNGSHDFTDEAVRTFNAALPSLMLEMDTSESRVILVDQYTDFDLEADTYDLAHPNDSGAIKMATRWFEAIDAYFGNGSEPPPPPPATDQFGNTRDNATTIGFVDQPRVIEDRVGDAGDPADWIRFKIGRGTVVRAALTGLDADVNIELWTSNVRVGSYNAGTADEYFEQQLAGGYYYLRIFSYDAQPTPYTLTLSALPPGEEPPVDPPDDPVDPPDDPVDPPDDPTDPGDEEPSENDLFGNTQDTATTIGFVDQPILIEDRVGDPGDPEDWIRFKIGRHTVVRAALTGLTADVNVEMWTGSKAKVGSYNSGTQDEFFEQQFAGGYYYLRVYSNDGQPTSYSLTLSALPPGEEPAPIDPPDDPVDPPVDPPDDPVDPPDDENPSTLPDLYGNTQDTATTIGFVDQPILIEESIGGAGDPEDWIRLKIGRNALVQVILTNLEADVNVEFWTGSMAKIGSYNSGTLDEFFERQFAGGYYYLRIFSADGDPTAYTLQLSALTPDLLESGAAAQSKMALLNPEGSPLLTA